MAIKPKAVFIRMDKIGDLVCTLPVDQEASIDQNWDIHWVISPGLGLLLDRSTHPRKYFELSHKFCLKNVKAFWGFIKANQFQAAVTFQTPGWILFLLFLARVPQRLAVRSKLASLLFATHSVRQKRSQSTKHEFDYNWDLARLLSADSPKKSSEILRFKISPLLSQKNIIIIHAGMAGSALNWSEEMYIQLSELILNDPDLSTLEIFWTGTASDEPYLSKIKTYLAQNANPRMTSLIQKLNLSELFDHLAMAKLVIAPSTGVLHLAASSNTSTLGLFSPIQVHHPRRWKARSSKAFEIIPDVQCKAQFHCLKEACPQFKNAAHCLEQIDALTVFKKMKEILQLSDVQ